MLKAWGGGARRGAGEVENVGSNEIWMALKAPPEAHVGGNLTCLSLHNSPNLQKLKMRDFFSPLIWAGL